MSFQDSLYCTITIWLTHCRWGLKQSPFLPPITAWANSRSPKGGMTCLQLCDVQSRLTHLLQGVLWCHWPPPATERVPLKGLSCQSGFPAADPLSHLQLTLPGRCSRSACSVCCWERICRLCVMHKHPLLAFLALRKLLRAV